MLPSALDMSFGMYDFYITTHLSCVLNLICLWNGNSAALADIEPERRYGFDVRGNERIEFFAVKLNLFSVMYGAECVWTERSFVVTLCMVLLWSGLIF